MATVKKTTTDEVEAALPKSLEEEIAYLDILEMKRREGEYRRGEEMRLALSEPFPAEVERVLRKGGAELTYIPVSEVIARLNKVLGIGGWGYEIIKCERDASDPDFVLAHVRLVVYSWSDSFGRLVRDGFGGQKVKRTKQGEIVDLGDEFKGAVSDALKKAAQSLGVGLYLARTEEALEALESPPVPQVDPKVAELWDNFVSFSKALTVEQKQELNKFWETYGKGKPKPTKTTANEADMTALIEECIRLSFAGE